jgi:hypothetical protein
MDKRIVRTRQFHVRLNDDERAAMQARAAAAGYDLSRFIRECGLHGKVSPVPAICREQWAYLAATTSNLNQLTRLCHAGKIPHNLDATIFETAKLLQEVRSLLKTGTPPP